MKQIIVIILVILLLFGCSQGVTETEDLQGGKEDEPEKAELFDAMDITGISRLIPLDDTTIFIIGVKKTDSAQDREIVYGFYNFDTDEACVLKRAFVPIDGAESAEVYTNHSGLEEFFTGRQKLLIDGNKVIDTEEIGGEEAISVSVDLAKGLAAISAISAGSPPKVYVRLPDGTENEIVKSEKVDNESGEEHFIFPYLPKIKGEKVLYGTAVYNAGNYKKIYISDLNGNTLCETAELEIIADSINFFWKDEGFITVETSDDLIGGIEGGGTVFKEYDENAKLLNEAAVKGAISDSQMKMYDGSNLYAYSYIDGEEKRLAVFDFASGEARIVESSENYILSPTVTPSGNYVVWAEKSTICRRGI